MEDHRRHTALVRARDRLPGYERWLRDEGWSPSAGWPPPVVSKAALFGDGLAAWFPPGPIVGAREVITSSGHGGRFSLGLVAPGVAEELGAQVDGILAELGADDDAPGMLVNCLPQGIAVPAGRAVTANCGVNVDAALALLRDVAPRQGPCLLVGEPLLLKELIERGAATGAGWAPERMIVVTGGEWVAEGLRRHLLALLPPNGAGILVSCGAAELGLHAFAEDPVLRALRGLLHEQPELRRRLLGDDPGFAPLLLGYDDSVLAVEPGSSEEPRLIVTTLDDRPLPLVRYDLGDRARPVDPAAAEALGGVVGLPVSPASGLIAHEGRADLSPGAARGPRVEAVKEALFDLPEWALALTGRFALTVGDDGVGLDVERHDPLPAGALIPDTKLLRDRLGVGRITFLPAEEFPHHSGGHGRKPQYRQELR